MGIDRVVGLQAVNLFGQLAGDVVAGAAFDDFVGLIAGGIVGGEVEHLGLVDAVVMPEQGLSPFHLVALLLVIAGYLAEGEVGVDGGSPFLLLGVSVNVYQSYLHGLFLSLFSSQAAAVGVGGVVGEGEFFFVDAGEDIGHVVVGVGFEDAEVVGGGDVEGGPAVGPIDGHDDLGVDHGGVGDDAALFVGPLVEEGHAGADFLSHVAAKGVAAAVALAEDIADGGSLAVDHGGDGDAGGVGGGGAFHHVLDEGEKEGFEAVALFVPDGGRAAIDVVGHGEGIVGALICHVDIAAGADIGAVLLGVDVGFEVVVEAAFGTGGVALVEAVEIVGVFLALGVEFFEGVAFRPEGVADVSATVEVAVVLDGADGGDVDDSPILAVGGVEDATGEVVLVPAGHNEQLAGVVVETGGEDGGVPFPHVVAGDGAVGLHSVLDGVVDDGDVGRCTREAAADADGLEVAGVADGLEHLVVADVATVFSQPLVVEEGVGEEGFVLIR